MSNEHNTSITAKIIADENFEIAKVPDRIFGSFVEHLGRCVYEGIYEPDHPLADENGFRKDVLELVRELGVTTIRYPGGNFVSGYKWEDGVGPRNQRPCRLDTAWHSTETNEFGLHEMQQWLESIEPERGTHELMEAINLGTRGLQDALSLVEYANIPHGTMLSDMRRDNGREKPFNIRMWCLGNEMDGPWQLGHKNAEDYGKLAADTARGIRQIDPNVELVVCGSSGHTMDTFGAWEETVLDHTYELIDFISCHAYYEPARYDNDIQSFLASAEDMNSFIHDVAAIIDAVKSRKKSEHEVFISFDEWNVWYLTQEPSKKPEGLDNWPIAPHILEDVYSVLDAVVFGDLLITLLHNTDRVKSASLAQLVNVIAPIMTQKAGPAWRQTTFYPFAITSDLAKEGTVLEIKQSSSALSTSAYGDVDAVNSVVVKKADGSYAIFITNRSLESETQVSICLPTDKKLSSVTATTLHDNDIYAVNTCDDPYRVTPQNNDSAKLDEKSHTITVTLPAVSWTAVHVQ
ncbi:alpha-L-arabinofuranosidase [Alloscardovia theropitheci]|uniref:non-reducing end alpha-L-arabinofuranosidase n=1 Tax=Alloscardovia theropitheci TaxID=2496842 RepID=A0A4R0QXY4_9BIFI|nr:alpha-L-arabinofuranosidase C-terminal domain-containing protein [Alloscardovia theropitheci]TCD54560.1 alpha-L-arabinofuranosidase [Alloscardovia theropitheci]